MKEIYYKVAGHAFVLQSRELGSLLCDLRQYEPFATEPTENVVFRLEVADTPPAIIGFEEQVRQEDEGQHASHRLTPSVYHTTRRQSRSQRARVRRRHRQPLQTLHLPG